MLYKFYDVDINMALQNNKAGFGLTQLLHAHDTGGNYQRYIYASFSEPPETRIRSSTCSV